MYNENNPEVSVSKADYFLSPPPVGKLGLSSVKCADGYENSLLMKNTIYERSLDSVEDKDTQR
jgi:hypothetical protein